MRQGCLSSGVCRRRRGGGGARRQGILLPRWPGWLCVAGLTGDVLHVGKEQQTSLQSGCRLGGRGAVAAAAAGGRVARARLLVGVGCRGSAVRQDEAERHHRPRQKGRAKADGLRDEGSAPPPTDSSPAQVLGHPHLVYTNHGHGRPAISGALMLVYCIWVLQGRRPMLGRQPSIDWDRLGGTQVGWTDWWGVGKRQGTNTGRSRP